MRQETNKNDFRALPLPDDWFITDEEAKKTITDSKGWVYRQYGKTPGEIPCFIFSF